MRHNGELMSLSLLASGLDADADTITLNAFQSHLLRELRDTRFEPAFDLTNLLERPLVATINFRSPELPADQQVVALVDRCFAAAYFRFPEFGVGCLPDCYSQRRGGQDSVNLSHATHMEG